jgi:cellulose biosynthesis protein BcsQ
LIQTLDLRGKASDDLAGLKSQLGLDPASYKTFQKARVKSDSPAPEPPVSDVSCGAGSPAGEPASRPASASEKSELVQPDPPTPASRPPVLAPKYTAYTTESAPSAEPLKKLVQFSRWDRWSALDVVLDSAANTPLHLSALSQPKQIPAVSIAGVAGGVGTTSIVAALARISSRRGGQVIVFDVSDDSLLSLFFSGRYSSVPIASFVFSGDANRGAIHTFRCDDANLTESTEAWLTHSLDSLMSESDELIVDAGLNRSCHLRHAKVRDSIEVLTLVPDTRCLAALKRFEDARHEESADFSSGPFLLLNQFDQSDPLHTEIRSRLANRYPHRLIPIAIRRDRQVPAALAEGMTIIDYAPESSASEDIAHLYQWFRARQQENSSDALEKVQIL